MVELNNGCVCCTINNDLVEAVYKVLERQEQLDYLVVETTGLADPLPVALRFGYRATRLDPPGFDCYGGRRGKLQPGFIQL